MTPYQTHSWASVVAFYREGASQAPRLAPMAGLVARIAESAYAAALHPVTQHYLLRLFTHDRFTFHDDQIQIDHDGEEFIVRYISAPRVQPASVLPITSDWSRRSADGFDALERCLDYLAWVVRERPASPS